MKMVKKKIYIDTKVAQKMVQRAISVLEPGTKFEAKIDPKGMLILKTNCAAVLEAFHIDISDFNDEDEND